MTGHNKPDPSLIGSLNQVKKVIGVMSGKGGVGKSTVSSLLAVRLAVAGYTVGILDADITGPSIPKAFGIKTGHNEVTPFGMQPAQSTTGIKIMSMNMFLATEDDPVIWRGPLIAGAVKQFWEETFWSDLDFLIVDLPPGTGDVALTVMQSIPLDGLIIVTSPQALSLMIVKKAIKMAEQLKVPLLGLVENMSIMTCPHCGESINLFHHNLAEEVSRSSELALIGRLPWSQDLNLYMDQGMIEKYQNDAVITQIDRLASLLA